MFFSFSLPLFLLTGLLRCGVRVCCFVCMLCGDVAGLKNKIKKLNTLITKEQRNTGLERQEGGVNNDLGDLGL